MWVTEAWRKARIAGDIQLDKEEGQTTTDEEGSQPSHEVPVVLPIVAKVGVVDAIVGDANNIPISMEAKNLEAEVQLAAEVEDVFVISKLVADPNCSRRTAPSSMSSSRTSE